METAFTPFQSAIGGALIGLAAVVLMAGLGRIMGATGILAGAIQPSSRGEAMWRYAVLAGMVSGPLFFAGVTGALPEVSVSASTPMLVIGGLLVGVGVTLGSVHARKAVSRSASTTRAITTSLSSGNAAHGESN